MIKIITGAALVASMTMAGAAGAATMTGLFDVTVVNVQDMTSAQSQASRANYDLALAETAGFGTNWKSDTFTYTGDLSFGTSDGTDATTISDWLSTGGGTVSGLEVAVSGLQLSKPNISNGSATTTFFLFSRVAATTAGDFTVKHDDGFAIYDDGDWLGGLVGPTSVKTTEVTGFSEGGAFEILYVATNGDPSILNVDTTTSAVPLPAAAWLFGSSLIALAGIARRKKVAA